MSWMKNFNADIRGPESAPKLVFLHGLMGAWVNWRKIIGAFEKDYRILAYDQRGHGRSFRPESGYGPYEYADDLLKILDELGWSTVDLVGHSMGGRNAMAFAYKHPERMKKLVVEDIGPEGSPENVSHIEGILAKVPTPFHDKRLAKETILSGFEDQVLANYLYSNIAEVSPGEFDWRFSKEAILKSVREARLRNWWKEWEGLQVPTLVVRGDKSDELSEATFQEMLSRQPQARGEVIQNAGHWVHFDQAQAFIEALKKFL